MTYVLNLVGVNGNIYEKIIGEVEILDIFIFVKEYMENGFVLVLRIFFVFFFRCGNFI